MSSSSSSSSRLESVAILGAGNWGTVLAILAARQVPKVYLYDRDERRAQEMQDTRRNNRYLNQRINHQ